MTAKSAPMVPSYPARGFRGAVATADQLATQAGISMIQRGGNAVDAAIAANAAMAVVGPHLCGIGGDLFALVVADGEVFALNATGRAGSGADAAALRAAGATVIGHRHDMNAVTIPGCVDGWVALHERFGSLPLAELLAPAIELATTGFAASPLLAASVRGLDAVGREQLAAVADQASRSAAHVRLPGVARTLGSIADEGRAGLYHGEFGAGLLDIGAGLFTEADLAGSQADWVEPLTTDVFGVSLSTIPPNSQGYLILGAARLAAALGVPSDPDDPQWAHLLVECAGAAGRDRPEVLSDRADGLALLAAIDRRVEEIDPVRASRTGAPASDGDTTYLCTADATGMAVSLIQSNASGFGSWVAEPNTGIGLHNRGIGFSLVEGHPAEYGPGRRPPHTLAPAVAMREGRLAAVFGTMGGDAQPQILLQIAIRLFEHSQRPDVAISAGRWALKAAGTGFDTWTASGGMRVSLEGNVASGWSAGLTERGHTVAEDVPFSSAFGHAHAIVVDDSGCFHAAADPRTVVGSAAAL
ncbi:MAG TPA: gamma-glutamyltransferase [Ilumatobacter sp.]|nr:gamma-glutamyltransferase [Ilumatobacter sp.]